MGSCLHESVHSGRVGDRGLKGVRCGGKCVFPFLSGVGTDRRESGTEVDGPVPNCSVRAGEGGRWTVGGGGRARRSEQKDDPKGRRAAGDCT